MAIFKGNCPILSAFGNLLNEPVTGHTAMAGLRTAFTGDNLADSLTKQADKAGKQYADALRNAAKAATGQTGRLAGLGAAGQAGLDWISAAGMKGQTGRWKNIAARAGVGIAGISVAGRLMGGGSLVTDREGRFNIAGVPFI